jgi:hypothetical protein
MTRKLLQPVIMFWLLVQAGCSKKQVAVIPVVATADPITLSEYPAAGMTNKLHIEAESYSSMSGVQTEPCREGGRDVGWINKGDWMDYYVDVATTGTQTIIFRVAGPKSTLQVKKADGSVLANVTLPGTSSGQVYRTTTTQVKLSAGKQKLRIYSTSNGWNFNWFELEGVVITPLDTTAATQPVQSSAANVSLYSAFENASTFNSWSLEICRPTALTISSEVKARKGNREARFELAKSDVTNYNGFSRAEIHIDCPTNAENWYAFSNYLRTDFVADPLAENIAQWHDVPDWNLGESWRSPPISLGIVNDRYYVKILWAAAPVNTNDTKDGEKDIDLGPIDKGKWNDWVFHIKFSYKSDGILEIYKNKVKIYSLYGPNSFNDKYYPYFKIGIYKWGWNGWASYSPENKRVLYYDEVRIGNQNANLSSVSPDY